MINPIEKEFELTQAFRDEQINIYSMTRGEMPGKYSHQIILCKKGRFEANNPQLLVPKVTLPKFKKSGIGEGNQRMFNNEFGKQGRSFPLKYVGFPAGVFAVTMDIPAMFDALCAQENALFTNWDPDGGPMEYFNGEDGNIQVFRVYEIDEIVPHDSLGRGQSRVSVKPQKVKILDPVIDDDTFSKILADLHKIIVEDCGDRFEAE